MSATCATCRRATACFHCERAKGPRFAVWSASRSAWLVDTCAGGTWRARVYDALEYTSVNDALDSLDAADLCIADNLDLVVVSL